MRGVLARRGIHQVIDVTHELPAHDVDQSGFWLKALLSYFPRAVHCVVVDPGVGGSRSAIVIRAGGHAFVGPDNGVCWPAASSLATTDPIETYEVNHVEPESDTFHGRDVFAPIAAAVATVGIDTLESLPVLEPTADPVKLALPQPDVGDTWIETPIVAIDGFGTAITAADASTLPPWSTEHVRVNGRTVPVAPRYGAVETGEALVTVGSHGYVELAANQAAGTDEFGVDIGDRVRISW